MDGGIDYARHSDAQLVDAARVIDRWQAPLDFRNLKRELESRGYRLDVDAAGGIYAEPSTETLRASIDSTDALVVEARTSSIRGWRRWFADTGNNWRLVGTVEVRVGAAALRVVGKRTTVLGMRVKTSIEVGLAAIVNVERAGDAVRFEYRPARGPSRYATVWLEDAAAADALASRLPTTRTADFGPVLGERTHFDELLAQLTPNTPVTHVLIGINVAVFLAMVAAGAGFVDADAGVHIRWGSNFGPYTTGGQWWRLVTSIFLHFGVIHLLFNMWALLTTGPLVERLYGSRAFAFLYLASGAVASVASVTWNPVVNSAGASGAIFGVYGALLAFLLLARGEIPASVLKSIRNSTLFFVLYSLGNGLGHHGIDNAAHVGGLCAGLVLGPLLVRRLTAGGAVRPAERRRRFAMAMALGAAVLVAGTAAARHVADASAEVALTRTFDWFTEGEGRAVDASKALGKLASAGTLSGEEFAARYERDTLAFWDEADARLATIVLPPGSVMTGQLARMRELTASRRKSGHLLVEGARDDDAAKVELAQAENQRMSARIAEWAGSAPR